MKHPVEREDRQEYPERQEMYPSNHVNCGVPAEVLAWENGQANREGEVGSVYHNDGIDYSGATFDDAGSENFNAGTNKSAKQPRKNTNPY